MSRAAVRFKLSLRLRILTDTMNLIYLAALIAACSAANLDRTYLPPPSAALSGGSPGSLQAPLTRTLDQTQNVPSGGFVNEQQEGVVVEAAVAGTRAASQQSVLGGNRNTYGSTDSKVGDAAFRTSPQKSQAHQKESNAAFGAHDEIPNPDLSAFYQPPPAFRPGNVQIVRDYVSNTIKYHNDVDLDKFNYAFETDNGIRAAETGMEIGGVKAQGGYSYTGDDGKVYSVSYVADENGFRAQGSHLPTPPPIPAAILKSLEQNARDEAAGIIDDGSYDPKKYNVDDDYWNTDTNDRYNGRLSNKFRGRPGSTGSGASINQNQQAFDTSKFNGIFDFGNQASNVASGFDTMNNRNNAPYRGHSKFNNGFSSKNEYLPPVRRPSGNIISAGGSNNRLPEQSKTEQKLQSSFDNSQSGFVRPSSQESSEFNSQGAITSQISSLPSNGQINQGSIGGFGLDNYNKPSIFSQLNFNKLQDNSDSDTSSNRNPIFDQQSTVDPMPPSSQNSLSQSPDPISSFSSQTTLPSQQFLSTNSPLQSTQNVNNLSPTTQFDVGSSGSFIPSQSTVAQTQYTNKPSSSLVTSFASVAPTKQPEIILTTPFETSKTNVPPTTAFDAGKTELLGFTVSDSTITNSPTSQFSSQSGQSKEKIPSEFTSTQSGNTFSGFSTASFNTNPQTTIQNIESTQTTQPQNREKSPSGSSSTLNGNTISSFTTSSFNTNPQTTFQNIDNTQTTQTQNKDNFPTGTTSTFNGNTFSGFTTSSFNTKPQTTSPDFSNTQTTQFQNKEKSPTESTTTLNGNTFSGSSFDSNAQTTSQNFDNTQTTQFLETNRPQVTQAVFSSSRPGDSTFAPNTQRPTYDTQSNQFTGQPQGPDHSYIYNRPSVPFHTPFVLHQTSSLPTGPQSNQFDKVTQSMTTPLDSTITTQYQSQFTSNNSPKPTSIAPFSPSFTKIQENNRNTNYFQASNGITQASISPFPSILPTVSTNAKQPSSLFDVKPFSYPSTISATATAEIMSTISDDQKNNAKSQSDPRPFKLEEKPNNEIYEYNKPTQGLPLEIEKDGDDVNQKTERPQFTTSTMNFNQDGTTTSVSQNTQSDNQIALVNFGQQSMSGNQQSFLDTTQNVPTTQFTQGSLKPQENTFAPSAQTGTTSFYKPSKFYPSTVSGDAFNPQKQDTESYTATTLAQNPTFGLQTTRFGSSDDKKTTISEFQQTNQQTETEFSNKLSTPQPGTNEQTQYTTVSQSFSSRIPTNQPSQFGIPSTTQFEQGSFDNKLTTTPQFQPSTTQFDYNPSTTTLLQTQSSGFNTQNPDKQYDFTNVFVQPTKEPSKFEEQPNTQQSLGSTTTSLFQKPSQQFSTTFKEPMTQTEMPGTTQFGEVYDYTKPAQSLITSSQNKDNVQSQIKPQFGVQPNTQFGQFGQKPQLSDFNLQPNKQYNQNNEKVEPVPHTTQAEPEYNTGSTLVPSTPQDQTTFITKVPDHGSTTGEIYEYTKPTQAFITIDKNRNHIDTPFGPQIIPIFQRVPSGLGQQIQPSNSDMQSDSKINGKEKVMSNFEAVTSNEYNTGSTPQDQSFNTQVIDQASTTGEVYEYTKPDQGLPSQPQKEIEKQQTSGQDQDKYESNQSTTAQSTPAPTTTLSLSQTTINSENANTLMPQSAFNQESMAEKKPFDSRPQLSFHSACCKGFRTQNKVPESVNLNNINKMNTNVGTNAFEQNKNIGQNNQPKLPVAGDFDPQRGSQTYAGIGEQFGGPRKPPHFDETGYHY